MMKKVIRGMAERPLVCRYEHLLMLLFIVFT